MKAERVRTGWVRRPPERGERGEAALIAAAVGVAVGLGAFYLAKLLLFREELRLGPPPPDREEEG